MITLPVIELASDYYLKNFSGLLNFVFERYEDLLTDSEKDFYQSFQTLSHDEQQLFVRLISRKGPYFRLGLLNYEEIEDISFAAHGLCENGYLFINPREGLDYALDTLRIPELKELGRSFGMEAYELSGSKAYLVRAFLLMDESVVWAALESLDSFLIPAHYEAISVFRLLFYGNDYQTLSDFILEDIGVLRYEPYEFNKRDRFFQSRDELEAHREKSVLKSELGMALDMNDHEWVTLVDGYICERVSHAQTTANYDQELNRIGAYYEKLRLFKEALGVYKLSNSHPAKERSIRVLDKLERHHEALEACEVLMKESSNYEERLFARFFKETQKRKLGLDYEKRGRIRFKQETVELVRMNALTVESQVVKYLNGSGLTAFYTENTLWKALFGLAFWDIIFSWHKDVFFNPFQRGPLDLRTSGFREKRAEMIENRLNQIREGMYHDQILACYRTKKLTANTMVNWKAVSYGLLESVLSILPAKDLAVILDRMAYQPGEFGSGFPDIFLMTENAYELIEVKGPGDQLRSNQRGWMSYFEEHQIPFKVLNVRWAFESEEA